MQPHDVRLLVGAALATAALAPPLLLGGWVAAGRPGLLGVATGLALTVAFFASSMLAVAAAARVSPVFMLEVGLGTYVVKIAALAVLLLSLRDVRVMSLSALAWAVVVGTVVWLTAEVRLFLTAKIPYVVIDADRR